MVWKIQHNKDINSPKLIYSYNVIPTNIMKRYIFCRQRQTYSRILIVFKETRRAKTILKKKNREKNHSA